MRFQTSQQMKLGQQMKLAPRMIQSMEILQMPLAELRERLGAAGRAHMRKHFSVDAMTEQHIELYESVL